MPPWSAALRRGRGGGEGAGGDAPHRLYGGGRVRERRMIRGGEARVVEHFGRARRPVGVRVWVLRWVRRVKGRRVEAPGRSTWGAGGWWWRWRR